MNAKSNAYQTETSEHASSEMFLPSRLNALREQLLRADEKNAELERERKAKKEEEKLSEAHTRELERELKFMRELNAKMTNDFIEVEAGRMRLRAEVDRLLKAETNAREIQEQMEKEKEKLRGMIDGDVLVNALIRKLFAKDEEELEEGASSPKAGEEDERSERLLFQCVSFEHTQTAKLVSDLESQLVLANKRLFECEKFQSETDSQLVKDKAELATAVARLQSFVERLSNAEKTKDDEIARLRQKRRALEKELDDLSLELENFRQKASCVAKCERKS
ncbi:unnamed protein product [Bathycoccus prasinos]